MLRKVCKKAQNIGNPSILVILCYIINKDKMSKIQAKNLTFKFVPYLFVAVTILTAFGLHDGIWV